jgi:hypothetical protein
MSHGVSIIVVIVAGFLGLAYLYLGGQCDDLGKDINRLEKRLESVRQDVKNEQFKWSRLTSTAELEKLLKRHNLVMDWPAPENIVRLRRGDLHLQIAQIPGMERHE